MKKCSKGVISRSPLNPELREEKEKEKGEKKRNQGEKGDK